MKGLIEVVLIIGYVFLMIGSFVLAFIVFQALLMPLLQGVAIVIFACSSLRGAFIFVKALEGLSRG